MAALTRHGSRRLPTFDCTWVVPLERSHAAAYRRHPHQFRQHPRYSPGRVARSGAGYWAWSGASWSTVRGRVVAQHALDLGRKGRQARDLDAVKHLGLGLDARTGLGAGPDEIRDLLFSSVLSQIKLSRQFIALRLSTINNTSWPAVTE